MVVPQSWWAKGEEYGSWCWERIQWTKDVPYGTGSNGQECCLMVVGQQTRAWPHSGALAEASSWYT